MNPLIFTTSDEPERVPVLCALWMLSPRPGFLFLKIELVGPGFFSFLYPLFPFFEIFARNLLRRSSFFANGIPTPVLQVGTVHQFYFSRSSAAIFPLFFWLCSPVNVLVVLPTKFYGTFYQCASADEVVLLKSNSLLSLNFSCQHSRVSRRYLLNMVTAGSPFYSSHPRRGRAG